MRILIVASGSPHTGQALLAGAQIARMATESPTILWVSRSKPPHSRLEGILASLRQSMGPGMAQVEVKARFGRLAEAVLTEIEQDGYDLVVVGERLRPGGRLRRLFGYASGMVAERAPCPVLIVKGGARPLRRILVCDSGLISPTLLDISRNSLAGFFDQGQEVTILHVMSQISAGPGVRGVQLRAGAEELMADQSPEGELLRNDLEILEGADLRATPKVRHGLVVDEILDEASGGDYDLVVIGAHPDQGWRRFLLDNLARRLLVRLDRPVLVMR